MCSNLPCAWFVGAHDVGKRSCISALVKRSVDRRAAAVWNIETKYYTAQVSLKALSFSESSPEDTSNCEALVLCFDATKESTFKEAVAWLQSNPIDAEIQLIVANKMDELCTGRNSTVQRSAWLQAAIEWSVEECFEYIEVSAAVPEIDQQLTLDGERQGIERVAEALKAHMWPGMERRQSKGKTTQTSEQASNGTSISMSEDISNGVRSSQQPDNVHAEMVGVTTGLDEEQMLRPNNGYEVLPASDDLRMPDESALHTSTASEHEAGSTTVRENQTVDTSAPGSRIENDAQAADTDLKKQGSPSNGTLSSSRMSQKDAHMFHVEQATATGDNVQILQAPAGPDLRSERAQGNGVQQQQQAAVSDGSVEVPAKAVEDEQVQLKDNKDDLKAGKDQEDSDVEEEDNLEELEKLMLEMQGARESLSKLPDEERRNEASRLALRMVHLLGLGDSDEEDD